MNAALSPPAATLPTRKEAARFLMHASLGASLAEIERVTELGFEGWIDEQFALPPSQSHLEVREHREAGRHFEMHQAWWRQVLTGKDLLRQRLAFALTEFFVVSEVAIEFVPWEMMKYYDELARLSSENWRDLLRMITLHPLMGYYLSHLRNRKADPAAQRYPDENFAREIMQLFTIGLWRLGPDGTQLAGPDGQPIPTYGNEEVTQFARVFTGLAYGGPAADAGRRDDFLNAPMNFEAPMRMWEEEHDQGEKRLMRGQRLPAFANAPGRSGMDDIEDALDNLFHHPNVGPFFCRFLIQRLVTSNPSPAYVGRVAAAFTNNGRAKRGDMRAVVKAVLLDPEAQGATGTPTSPMLFGRMHEPYLRYVRLARTFEASSEAGSFNVDDHNTFKATNQILLASPSVFNFFLPNYQPPGAIAEAGCCAPEFQLMTSSTAITSLNHYMGMVNQGFGNAAEGPEVMRLNLAAEIALAKDPDALIALLNLKMAAGGLGGETIRILSEAYRKMPENFSAAERVKGLMELIVVSPDFAIFE
jgi:uncharacterized protein (DUF1800 family)